MTIDPKRILIDEGWKDVAPDCKGKDKELVKTLLNYQAFDEKGDFDLRFKTLGRVAALAGTLKSANEVKSDADAVKYLTALIGATKVKQAEIMKARAEAQKVEVAAQKKAEAGEQAGKDDPADDEQLTGVDPYKKLELALKTLKSSRDPYFFLYCKDKPYGLAVSRKNIWQDARVKKEVSTMAGGSTAPLIRGLCRREGDKNLIFEPADDKPVPGMARLLPKWIKENTPAHLAFKVFVGDESGEEADDAPPSREGVGVAAPADHPALARIPAAWEEVRLSMTASIDELKQAIRKGFAGEARGMVAEIERDVQKLDRVFGARDQRLTASLAKAQAANDAAARNAELKNTKALLADYIKYVKTEPLIAHIDSNPFGVRTNLRQRLTDLMTRTAQAIS